MKYYYQTKIKPRFSITVPRFFIGLAVPEFLINSPVTESNNGLVARLITHRQFLPERASSAFVSSRSTKLEIAGSHTSQHEGGLPYF